MRTSPRINHITKEAKKYMPKNPTVAANNVFCIARKEAASFNDSLNSREGASELLGIDRTRIARIELGSLNPYPEEVLMMSDAYNAPELNNHYCSQLCPLGKKDGPTGRAPPARQADHKDYRGAWRRRLHTGHDHQDCRRRSHHRGGETGGSQNPRFITESKRQRRRQEYG